MTVDVEDYFQVQAFANVISRDEWDHLPTRVEANVERILEQFDRAAITGTFFTLGWVAERYPALVRRIVAGGHELASHGYGHARVDSQDRETFCADIRRAKRVLEDVGGVPVAGYRAPTFSIGQHNLWAFDVLEAEGYRYSSSVYPVHHDLYGMPAAPRFPFHPNGGYLWELPMTAVRLFGRNWPSGGGGYFRLLPYPVFRGFLRRFNKADHAPGIFYFHPWEIDADQPRILNINRRTRFRHYVNIAATYGRIERLLRDFSWDRMDRVFADLLTPSQRTGPQAPHLPTS
jgi:polysaccharide deacetylase family protein (PEP-CTERM system associated)